MRQILLAAFLFLSLLLAHPAAAATLVSAELSGTVTWTPAESPYIVSVARILSGSSLTIEPGTIIKVVDNSYPFMVDNGGTLTIGSMNADPVIITSIKDDTIGGDTNGDGSATPPSSGDWRTITIAESGVVNITNTAIRYGGMSYYDFPQGHTVNFPLIHNNGGTLHLDHVELAHSSYSGVNQSSGTTTIVQSTITNTSTYGVLMTGGYLHVASTTLDTAWRGIAVADGTLVLQGNTFTNLSSYAVSLEEQYVTFINHGGNTGTTGIFINQTIQGQLTLPKDGLVYVMGSLTVPADATLTVLPGTLIKVLQSGGPFAVTGTLTVGADGAEPVIITSITDDTIGGDTNGDGATTLPSSGDWRSITLNPNSSATITNTTIRYGGASPYNPFNGGNDWLPAIRKNGGTLLMDHVTMTDNGNFALLHYSGTTTITHSEIARTSRYGIFLVDGTLSITDSSIHDNATYGVFNGTQHTITATHNWWGHAGGPTHPSNPFGAGDRVSDDVEYGGWLLEEPGGACVTDCYSNVLFLPGLQASRLYEEDAFGFERRRWEPRENLDVKNLFLDETGKHPASPALADAKIYTRDVIGEAYPEKFGLLAPNVYESFIAQMDTMVAEGVIREWKAIPYDWRLAFSDMLASGKKEGENISYTAPTSSPYIIQELKRLAVASKTKKVTIVAHSNGGLLAKALLQQLGDEEAAALVDNVIFVASPQSGTPQAIGALLHGYKLGLPAKAPLFLSPDTARALAKNFPGAYTLLPSDAYFRDVATPVATFDATPFFADETGEYGTTIESTSELSSFLLNNESDTLRASAPYDDTKTPAVLNNIIQNSAGEVHETIDDWMPPPTIKVYQIAGWGIDTLATIRYKEKKHLFGNSTWNYGLGLTQDGDGTVVVPSALQLSTSTANVSRWWVDLQEYDNLTHLSRDHADILEIDGLRNFIANIITNTDTIPASYISATRLTPTNQNKRLRFFLYSPLSLELYDGEGRHTGISRSSGLIDQEISGAYYSEFGEVKYITAPASTTLHLVLNGEASGSFTLEIQEVIGDTITATTTFVDIPSSTSTIVTMDFTDGTITNASLLYIDAEGDGIVDVTLLPQVGAEVFVDSTPPEAMIAFQPATLGLLVTGLDTQSVPAVSASGTIYTVIDTTGNMLQLRFSQLLTDTGKQSKVAIESLRYDNEATLFLGTTTLKYEWALDKEQMVKMLNQEARVGEHHVHAHYSAKDERTTITAHVNGMSTTSVAPGLVVVRLRTNGGIMEIVY